MANVHRGFGEVREKNAGDGGFGVTGQRNRIESGEHPIRNVEIDLGPIRKLAASPEFWAWVAVGIGVLLRVAKYLANRSLYIDEKLLLGNLIDRPVFDLGPLGDDQLAPPLFLFLERMMARLPLRSHYGARLFPLIAGVASMFLMRDVARRCPGRWGVPAAVLLFGMSDYALYYSSEIKQYSSDIAFTLAIVSLALRPGLGLACIGVVGVVAPWFSHPSCFVLASTGTYLAASALNRGDRRTAGIVIGWSLAWAISFAGSFALSQRLLTPRQFIWDWWDFAFLPIPPRSAADAGRVGWHLVNVFTNPVGVWTPLDPFWTAMFGLGLYAIGFATIARTRPGLLVLLAGPMVVALAASAVKKYPFHGRLLMFLVPLVWIVIAAGVEWVARRVGRGAGLLLVGFLILSPGYDVLEHLAAGRPGIFDSHGDLRNDLLDHLDRLRTLDARRE